MNIPWGSKVAEKFITNVGLITSDGPIGPNIMACEWTQHISYSPGLIAICIGHNSATTKNIRKTKQFGVNLCATDQNVMSSVAGGYSGKETDKISALKELGFGFYKAKKIKAPMVKGAAANIECRMFKEITIGDHIVFVGKAVAVSASNKEPIAYHQGKYWSMTKNVRKPSDSKRKKIREIAEKFSRS